MSNHSIHRLHYLTQDLKSCSHAAQALMACKAGATWVQCRIKNRNQSDWLAEAGDVKAICSEYKAVFIVNDNVQIAERLDANGVHLGLSDMPLKQARSILGKSKIIGGTANTRNQIIQRVNEGADYIGLGPYRFTRTKKNLSPIIGLDAYPSLLKAAYSIPVIAVGGITIGDVTPLLNAGLHGIAISSAINGAGDPAHALSQFLNRINNSHPTQSRVKS